jgi:PPOX class probable F420-dependent enzyme
MMTEEEAREFLRTHRQGILATIRKDGRPQLSNVLAVYWNDRIAVSITETRSKYHNLLRDPRASILMLGDNFWQYLVVDGTASMTHLPEAQGLLREYYEMSAGKPHPDWDEYDDAMRKEKRVLLSISIDHMYPLSS